MYAEAKANEALATGDMRGYEYWMRVKAEVDKAPPLVPEIRDRLSVLLRPALPDRMPPRPAPAPKPVEQPEKPKPQRRRRTPAPRSSPDMTAAAPAPDVAPAA